MNAEGTAPRPPDPTAGGPAAAGPDLAAEISRRVGAILDAVEREASRLREEARADAARYLEDARRQADALVTERQRRIAELSDELVTKTEAVISRLDDAGPVRDGFEHLVRALGNAAERLSHEVDAAPERLPPASPAPFAAPAARPPFPAPAVPVQAPAQAPVAPSFAAPRNAGGRDLEDARMIAVQMAAVGNTRAEVGEHLRRVLGIGDPSRTLDEVFGPGGDEGGRLPGTGTRG